MFTSAFTPAFRPLFRSNEAEQTYIDKVKSIFDTSLIAYWPLNEASGTTAYDVSGNGLHGTYTGVDLGQAGIGDGETSPYFDGANDYVNVYSAGLASAFNGDEGTVLIWYKVTDADVWTDGIDRYLLYIATDGLSIIRLTKRVDANQLLFTYRAGGTFEYGIITGQSSTGWIHMAMTWDAVADEVKYYIDGSLEETDTGLGTWAGNIISTFCHIGAGNEGTAGNTDGYLAHCAIGNTALTPAQIAELAVIP